MFIKHKKNIKCSGTPLCLSISGNEIYLIDSSYVFYRINKEDLRVINIKRITLKFKPHHNLYRGFSAAGSKIAVTFTGNSSITLLDVENDIKKIGTAKWHVSDVEASAISLKNGYLFSGAQDGKVYIYDLKSVSMIGSFAQKPDYISNIAVADEKNLIAISSFNKQVSIHDIDKNTEIGSFFIQDVAQNTIFFDDDNSLFIACRDGSSGVYDIKEKIFKCSRKAFSDWPMAVAVSKDKRHALVGTRDGHLHAIEMATNTERFNIKVRDIGISNLHLGEEYLYISYFDGITELLDINCGEENIKRYIQEQNFDKAREELNLNVMLYMHPVTRLFDEAWSSAVAAIKNALVCGDIGLASKIATPFLFDNGKKAQFNELMVDLQNVKEFKEAYDAENYTLAYELAEKEPLLKQFPIYDSMEGKWEKIISSIKVLMQNDPQENKLKCNALLKPFAGIPSKRKIAQDIINNAHFFIEAENAVAVKDFKEYYRLVKTRPFLKDTPMYKKMEALSLRIMEKINDYMGSGSYAEVVKLAKNSLNISPIEMQLKEIMVEVANRLKFMAAIKAQDFNTVYEILEKYEDFFYLKEFDPVEQKFKEHVKKATEFALKGKSSDAYDELGFYFGVKFRIDKVAQIMKIAYLNEISENAQSGGIHWEKTFKGYCTLFSNDAEIKRVAALANKTESLQKAACDKEDEFGYRKHEMPESIIQFYEDSAAL